MGQQLSPSRVIALQHLGSSSSNFLYETASLIASMQPSTLMNDTRHPPRAWVSTTDPNETAAMEVTTNQKMMRVFDVVASMEFGQMAWFWKLTIGSEWKFIEKLIRLMFVLIEKLIVGKIAREWFLTLVLFDYIL